MRHHILLIENDEPLHDAVVQHLVHLGHRVTACRSRAEAERALDDARNRTQAPNLMVADASCMGFYLKARQRFPGLRWVLSDANTTDPVPYDASIDQPDVTFPPDMLH